MQTRNTIILLAVLTLAAALNPIVTKGRYFFDSVTGEQFYVVGAAYQPTPGVDPIADIAGLKRDIPYLTSLGVNTIRCYYTDNTVNHDAGMRLLEQAGIYALFDLSTPDESIISTAPSWTTDLFDSYKGNVDAFIGYANTLGYIAGNEVILADGTTPAGAYVKASIRDVKSYLASKGSSKPVGYAAADVPTAGTFQSYLDCGSPETSADFFGLNIYRWCGNANLQTSGYLTYEQTWESYSIPIIFTEYGCIEPKPRLFNEVLAIYSSPMTNVLSGGLVYEYVEEVNNYGLVQVVNSTYAYPLNPEFNTFKSQVAKINPTRLSMDTYSQNLPQQACPAVTSAWQSASSPLPPVANHAACQCMFQQLPCRTAFESTESAPSTDLSKIGDVLNYVCGNYPDTCTEIATNSVTGTYGKWSMCNALERVSWAMAQYYTKYGNSQASACDFGGLGNVVTPTVPTTTQCDNTPSTVGGSPVATTAQNSAPTTSQNVAPTTGSIATSSSSGGLTCEKTNYCDSTLCGCNGACYKPTDYCCLSGQLTQIGFCPKSNTPSTTNQVAASTTKQAVPSTSSTSASPVATSSSSGGLTCEKTNYCDSTLCGCNGACYKPTDYCCMNGQLTQALFCPSSATPSTTQSPAITPTSTTQSPVVTRASTTSAANTPVTSSSTCQKASYCGSDLCACGEACYSPTYYCCPNGNLTQKSFC